MGWDIRAWLRGRTPDEYPPEKLPAFFWQPKSHQIFISKRKSGDDGRASLPGAGDYPEDYPDLVDLRVHHEPDLSHQTPVDRRKAFDELCFLGEPIALKLLGQPDAVIYEELSHASAKDYETGGRLYFRTLTLIKSEFDLWCESQKIDSPKFAFQGSRPESEVGSAPSGDLSATPQASQATPESQAAQGSEPLEKTAPHTMGRRQQRSHETEQKYERWYGMSQDIKDPEKPRRPIEIARIIAKQETKAGNTKANAETIKRRLNKDHPGWAD